MEVAGQWRREWAGTAEYGKVIEGGVTKRVARAMEVLNASAPGARVRVMRAAYHSTSGPGIPASSYMLQSSRRVITSGYDFVEPTSIPSKPLEISSVPLDVGIESDSNAEKPNYKVTEPDDTEISEPSKWRSASGKSSIRFPSEESSSTDNASLIDLDSRSRRSDSFGNHMFDNNHENVKSTNAKNTRVSPLLDAPVTLSTLKYKSLLNGSDDWNNRRKSYSFEDTAPLNKNILDRIDRFAIESSTDSGICKSSEVVNDVENTRYQKPSKERKSAVQDESFKDWLAKNRINLGKNSMSPLKERSVTPDRLSENNITLQSSGKVCITLPVTVEADDGRKYVMKPQINDESDRKSKKVEFCKTELHFAVDTGTVNIIATDEKPPPTNDFRRRRSAFVPINDRFEKSVTLFGEKTDFSNSSKTEYSSSYKDATEISDPDENTAATKSILKNKIPKPKPYLLGENMNLGIDNGIINTKDNLDKNISITGVSLINSQLKASGKYNEGINSEYCSTKVGSFDFASNSYRTTNEGTFMRSSFSKQEKKAIETNKKLESASSNVTSSIKKKIQVLQTSPTLSRSNARQLKDSELIYFGVEKNQTPVSLQNEYKQRMLYDNNKEQEEMFESVRLVRRASNSVCSSEIESDEAPEYQNIPSKLHYAPVPKPRLRTKFTLNQTEVNTGHLNSIEEQDNDESGPAMTRRSRLRRKDSSSPLNRSISEPPKVNRQRHRGTENTSKTYTSNSGSFRVKNNTTRNSCALQDENVSDNSSFYVNLTPKQGNKEFCTDYKTESRKRTQVKSETSPKPVKEYSMHRSIPQRHKHEDIASKKLIGRSDSANSKSNIYDNSQLGSRSRVKRTEKLITPELSTSESRRLRSNINKTGDSKTEHRGNDYRPKSLHRHMNSDHSNTSSLKKDITTTRDPKREREKQLNNEKYESNQYKHSLVNNNNLGNISPDVPAILMNSSSKMKTNEKKHHEPKKTRRSEYVINYDDKNGTVSSVRKLKPFKFSSEKNTTKANKENSNDQNGRVKQLNKIALQQNGYQATDYYEKGYMDKTRKRKPNVHKTCQLL